MPFTNIVHHCSKDIEAVKIVEFVSIQITKRALRNGACSIEQVGIIFVL